MEIDIPEFEVQDLADTHDIRPPSEDSEDEIVRVSKKNLNRRLRTRGGRRRKRIKMVLNQRTLTKK